MLKGLSAFLAVVAAAAALLAPPSRASGRDLESALEAIPEIWLSSLAPVKAGTNLWEGHQCESTYPIVNPATGVIRAQASADRVEVQVDALDPGRSRAVLGRVIFTSPVVAFTTLYGPAGTEVHNLPGGETGISLADILAYPDLEVGLLDLSGGRVRIQERRPGDESFDLEIVDIRFQGRNLDALPSPGGPQMSLVGSARVAGENRGKLTVQWFATPGEGVADARFSLGLDELDLTLLYPLIAREMEFKLEQGKVSLLVNGTCAQGRFLHTDNHLILEDVRIGTGNEGTLGELTLAAVASMLGGVLSVEFPVDGDLADPDFDLLEAYADGAAISALNQTADLLLDKLPAKNRSELKERLIDWVAPDLPEDQKRAILDRGDIPSTPPR